MTEPSSPVPTSLRTARLLLRPWAPADAEALSALLTADAARLAPWLPARVACVAPLAELRERLAGYAADFAARRAFRYALVAFEHGGSANGPLLGGADLHPRSAAGRVPIADADCLELGYWIASAGEGLGFATEAARALLEVARSLRGIAHVEARIDGRNARSIALVRRLGFRHALAESGFEVWRLPLDEQRG